MDIKQSEASLDSLSFYNLMKFWYNPRLKFPHSIMSLTKPSISERSHYGCHWHEIARSCHFPLGCAVMEKGLLKFWPQWKNSQLAYEQVMLVALRRERFPAREKIRSLDRREPSRWLWKVKLCRSPGKLLPDVSQIFPPEQKRASPRLSLPQRARFTCLFTYDALFGLRE